MDEVQSTMDGYMQKPNPCVLFMNSSSCEDLISGFGAAFSFCSVDIFLWVLLLVITIGSYYGNKKGLLLGIFGESMAKSRGLKHGFSFRYGVSGLFRSNMSSCLIGSGKFSKNRPVEKTVKSRGKTSEKSAKEEEGRSHGDGTSQPRVLPSRENTSCLNGCGIGGGTGAGSGKSQPRVLRSQENTSCLNGGGIGGGGGTGAGSGPSQENTSCFKGGGIGGSTGAGSGPSQLRVLRSQENISCLNGGGIGGGGGTGAGSGPSRPRVRPSQENPSCLNGGGIGGGWGTCAGSGPSQENTSCLNGGGIGGGGGTVAGSGKSQPRVIPSQENTSCLNGGGIGGGTGAGSGKSQPRVRPSQENTSCLNGGGIGGGGVTGAGSVQIQPRVRPCPEISSTTSPAEEKSDKISEEVGGENRAELAEEMSMEELKEAIQTEREEKNRALTELDKERMSSTLAANEAMDMIRRIQSEKSSIQMESNHSKRLAEQKQRYDEEIIQSLRWVAFKHESDRSVLENQLRMCKLRLKQCLEPDEMEQFEEELMLSCANAAADGEEEDGADTGSETSI